jgi:hypothetical protein
MTETTRYDRVSYPSMLFASTLPSYMAAVARFHGLSSPEVATARVLEIAGGDGVNVISMAATYPEASFHSFDLAASAVARGQRLLEAAGLTNVVVETRDLIEAAETLTGPYDYIIAHGLYAWVPEGVREAMMRLVGRTLAPDGIAFVSYNAQPGGYFRFALRDLVLHEVGGIADPIEQARRAHALIKTFAQPQENDRTVVKAAREMAAPMVDLGANYLHHDLLSDVFAPQRLTDVLAHGAAHDLAFLNDAIPGCYGDGLPGEEMDDATTIHLAQASDYQSITFFHQTLFIRPGRAPRRTLDIDGIGQLYAASSAQRLDGLMFRMGRMEFEVESEAVAEALVRLAAVYPVRLRVAELGPEEIREPLWRLSRADVVKFRVDPMRAVREAGERPLASPVARAQVALGARTLYTLDHVMLDFETPGPRHFLTLLDGTRDRAALAADWAASDYGHEVSVGDALDQFGRAAMLLA